MIRNPVEVHQDAVACRHYLARHRIQHPLLQFDAAVAHFNKLGLTDNFVMDTDREAKIQVHMYQDPFKSQPIYFGLQYMFKKLRAAIVIKVHLTAIVDVVERVQVTHPDLHRA